MVIEKTDRKNKSNNYYWLCKCDCGKFIEVIDYALGRNTNSCGCIKNTIKIGDKFGRLTIISKTQRNNGGNIFWNCECECGKTVEVRSSYLKTGHSKSCGCLSIDIRTKHGVSGTRLYSIWHSMQARCFYTNDKNYKNYGGRGITVCESWKNIENFINDVLESYDNHVENFGIKNTTIDRKNVNGNYEPGNYRWATTKEQSNNKRNSRFITFNGKTQTVSQLGKRNWDESNISND